MPKTANMTSLRLAHTLMGIAVLRCPVTGAKLWRCPHGCRETVPSSLKALRRMLVRSLYPIFP